MTDAYCPGCSMPLDQCDTKECGSYAVEERPSNESLAETVGVGIWGAIASEDALDELLARLNAAEEALREKVRTEWYCNNCGARTVSIVVLESSPALARAATEEQA